MSQNDIYNDDSFEDDDNNNQQFDSYVPSTSSPGKNNVNNNQPSPTNNNNKKNNSQPQGIKVDYYYNPSQGQMQFLLLPVIKSAYEKQYVLQIQAAKINPNETVQYKGRVLNKCDWQNKVVMNLSAIDIATLIYEYQKQKNIDPTKINAEIKHLTDTTNKLFAIVAGKQETLGLRIGRYAKSNYDNKNNQSQSPNIDVTVYIKESQIFRFFEMLKSVLKTQLAPIGLL